MLNPDCLFCNIVSKKIPAQVIYEDDHTLAFLDIMPRTIGHTLVIPKDHAPTIIELSEAEVAPLFLTVKKMSTLLKQKLGLDGMTIGINQGRVSGQEVDHLHVHLMPRSHGDGGGSLQSVVNNKPKESVEAIRAKLIN